MGAYVTGTVRLMVATGTGGGAGGGRAGGGRGLEWAGGASHRLQSSEGASLPHAITPRAEGRGPRAEVRRYGKSGGGTLRFVACSNAYASRSSVGSLHAIPVNVTPYGLGFALNVSANAGVGAFGTIPNGTITDG